MMMLVSNVCLVIKHSQSQQEASVTRTQVEDVCARSVFAWALNIEEECFEPSVQ